MCKCGTFCLCKLNNSIQLRPGLLNNHNVNSKVFIFLMFNVKFKSIKQISSFSDENGSKLFVPLMEDYSISSITCTTTKKLVVSGGCAKLDSRIYGWMKLVSVAIDDGTFSWWWKIYVFRMICVKPIMKIYH